MQGDRLSRREMDSELRIFKLMLRLGENWYLGKFYSRYALKKCIQELESMLISSTQSKEPRHF